MKIIKYIKQCNVQRVNTVGDEVEGTPVGLLWVVIVK